VSILVWHFPPYISAFWIVIYEEYWRLLYKVLHQKKKRLGIEAECHSSLFS
jgi:hypothetical protein